MKLWIDTESKVLVQETGGQRTTTDLYSKQAFETISQLWLKVGWNEKYPYIFTWMGRPVIQNPEDMIRAQEVIYRTKPDVIIETGVAHGGSLVFYASLCKAMETGRVIGVDVEIRPNNRKFIENHELFPLISLIEGNSVDPAIVQQVKSQVNPGEKVLVFLDSNHSKDHVLAELEAYHGLVTSGSYIVATDGITKDLYDVPCGKPEWVWDNPVAAVNEFIQTHPEFVVERLSWPFNESLLTNDTTHWPDAWLLKK